MTSADLAPTAAPRPLGRALARTQFLLVGAYVVGVGVALARAAAFSGHLYLPRQGDDATGNADLWPGLWGGVWLVLVVVIGMVPLAAAGTAIVAVARLASHRMRAESARWRSLLVSTILAALVVAAWLSPQSTTLYTWLLD
jgi:predicted lysophospholipase L1 biosynthesis ABC-type transport system permease subunit